MTGHPQRKDISAYVDGMLDTRQMRRVAQHLGACQECRSLAQSFRQTKMVLKRLAAPETPGPDFWPDTFRRLRTEGETRPTAIVSSQALFAALPRSRRRLRVAAAVAALGAVFVGSVLTPLTHVRVPAAAAGSMDSVDISSLVRAHTASAARQPFADPDRQTMMSADVDNGVIATDASAEATAEGRDSADDAAR